MDVVARILSEAISTETGKPAIVENKPGAGGAIGVQALLSAPPDGQTIMFMVSNILTEIPLVMKTSFEDWNLGYGAAMSLGLLIILVLISIFQLWLLRVGEDRP